MKFVDVFPITVEVDMFPPTGRVDMFPSTIDINLINSTHVESVVLLSREKADDYVRISVNTKDLHMRTN